MRNNRRSTETNYWLSLVDMLFAMVLAYVVLFMISQLLIRPQTKPIDSNISLAAQMIIQLSWPDDTMDDVDLWLQLPDRRKVSFNTPSNGWATLERDDLGAAGDMYTKSDTDSTIEWVKLNRELITIRAFTAGRYVIAIHVFKTHKILHGIVNPHPLPYLAHVDVTKLNPSATVVGSVDIPLRKIDDQVTVLAFTVDSKGTIVSVEQFPPDRVIEIQRRAEDR